FELPVPTILDSDKSESGFESSPRVGTIAALLLLPLVLILLNTGLNTIGNTRPDPEAFLADAWVAGLRMIGETPIALLITVVVSMFVLGWGAGKEGSLIEKVTDSAIGPIASVVLITGAGGMFGGVLRVTGIGDAVAGSLNDIGMPVIVAAYLIAQIVRLAQGSATVALTTAASLMVGVLAARSQCRTAPRRMRDAGGARRRRSPPWAGRCGRDGDASGPPRPRPRHRPRGLAGQPIRRQGQDADSGCRPRAQGRDACCWSRA